MSTAHAENTRVTVPDWVFDALEDETDDRRFWITKGLGSGGTYGGVIWHLTLSEQFNYNSPSSWVVAPTFTQVRDPLIPTFIEVMQRVFGYEAGQDYELIRSGAPRIELASGHTIYFKSANRPEMFVGANISHYLMTEPGLIARLAYEKTNDRLRCPKAGRLQAMLEGTPEGVGNFYQEEADFEGEILEAKNYRRFIVWTEDNPYLDNYAEKVRRNYGHDKAKLESYLYGRFVPLTKGNAYWEFSHSRNVKLDLAASEYLPLTITWDWNHTPLAFVAWQRKTVHTRAGDVYSRIEVLGESSGKSKGIMDACAEFIAQFPPDRFRDTPIEIDGGCDGYAKSHLTNLCAFDQVIQVLKKYYTNVKIVASRKAPLIEHRLQRHNALLAYAYLVIAAWCRNTIKSHETTNLKKHSWDIDKSGEDLFSHWGDGLGYSIFRTTKGLDLEKNDGKNRQIYGFN